MVGTDGKNRTFVSLPTDEFSSDDTQIRNMRIRDYEPPQGNTPLLMIYLHRHGDIWIGGHEDTYIFIDN
jgi:hypothetical protein